MAATFAGIGRCVIPGVKEGIPTVFSGVTILAACRSVIFLMTTETILVIGPLQPRLVDMIQLVIGSYSSQIIYIESFGRMAILADHGIRFHPALMTFKAAVIFRLQTGCVMMAAGAVALHHINMHGMIKRDRFIKICQNVQFN